MICVRVLVHGMCDLLVQLTGNHSKKKLRKAVNYSVVRKGMMDRDFRLHPTISGSWLIDELNSICTSDGEK